MFVFELENWKNAVKKQKVQRDNVNFTSYKPVYILFMSSVKPHTYCPITKCQGCSTTTVLPYLL